jgi:PBP1b-binding outer membrane lipoprotein LpoB
MKKLVLFVALVAAFGLSFVSCSSGKSEESAAEKDNTESVQQAPSDLSSNAAGDVQSSQQQ